MTPGEREPSAGAGRCGVILASAGRAADLAQLLAVLGRQTRPPDVVVLSLAAEEDAPAIAGAPFPVVTTIGARGLTAQRNAGLAAAVDCDLVVFFDDDFLPAPDYLAQMSAAMERDGALSALDGQVVFDGAAGPGVEWAAAAALLAAAPPGPTDIVYDQPDGLYGCNMCCRVAALGPAPFDEALPLYGWLEDYDFGRRLAREGRIGRVMAARGVHLGVKRGRTSGLRMGYSQIANPVHLRRKGTMPLSVLAHHIVRRMAGNMWGMLRDDAIIDRRGRLRGNMLALCDGVRGRLSPGRILDL